MRVLAMTVSMFAGDWLPVAVMARGGIGGETRCL